MLLAHIREAGLDQEEDYDEAPHLSRDLSTAPETNFENSFVMTDNDSDFEMFGNSMTPVETRDTGSLSNSDDVEGSEREVEADPDADEDADVPTEWKEPKDGTLEGFLKRKRAPVDSDLDCSSDESEDNTPPAPSMKQGQLGFCKMTEEEKVEWQAKEKQRNLEWRETRAAQMQKAASDAAVAELTHQEKIRAQGKVRAQKHRQRQLEQDVKTGRRDEHGKIVKTKVSSCYHGKGILTQ
jgi:hypothetical protein